MINTKNDNLIKQLDSHFQRAKSPLLAWADAIGSFSNLPGLRGFWPMVPLGATANCTDYGNNNRTLTALGAVDYAWDLLFQDIGMFNPGVEYLTRPDEAEFDILGTETYIATGQRGLTMGGWFKFWTAAGAVETAMSKWNVAGGQTSYLLQRDVGGTISFFINAVGNVVTSVEIPLQDEYNFLACSYDYDGGVTPEIKVYVNDTDIQSNAVGIPGPITNSTAPFEIGAATGANGIDGTATLCFITATYLWDFHIQSLYNISKALFNK